MRGSPLLLCGLAWSLAFAATPEPAKTPPFPALLPKPVLAKPVNVLRLVVHRLRIALKRPPWVLLPACWTSCRLPLLSVPLVESSEL